MAKIVRRRKAASAGAAKATTRAKPARKPTAKGEASVATRKVAAKPVAVATAGKSAFLILGMHRSGTSMLAGMLQRLGGTGPRTLMTPSISNPKGFGESIPFMNLHNRVLASAGTDWKDWTPLNPDWVDSDIAAGFEDEFSRLYQEEFGDARLTVMKDPRICRFAGFWLDHLEHVDIRPLPLIAYRNPLEVAGSLKTRDRMPATLGAMLWLRHVLDAEYATRGRARSFVNYHDVLRDWRSVADRIRTDLKIKWPRYSRAVEIEMDEWVDQSLHREVASDEAALSKRNVADWVRRTYMQLLEISRSGESAAAYRTFDEIRTAFDQSSGVFGPLLHELEKQAATSVSETERLASELSTNAARIKSSDDRANAFWGERDTARKRIAELEETGAQLKADLDAARKQVAELVAGSESHGPAMDRLSASLEGLEAKLEAVTQRETALARERDALRAKADQLAQANAAALSDADAKSREAAKANAVALADLETKLQAAAQREAALGSKLEEVRKQSMEHAETSESWRQSVKERDRALEARRTDIANLQQARTAQDQQVRGLNTAIAELKTRVATGETQAATLAAERDALLQRVERLTQDGETALEVSNAEITALKAAIASSETQSATLAAERDALLERIERLTRDGETALEMSNADITALKAAITSSEAQSATLASERDALLQRIERLMQEDEAARAASGAEIARLKAVIADSETKAIAADDRIKTLTDELGAARLQSQTLEASLADGLGKLAAARREAADFEAAIGRLESAVQTSEARIKSMVGDLAVATAQAQQLAKAGDLARTELQTQGKVLAARTAERDARQKDIETLKAAIGKLEGEAGAARTLATKLSTDVDTARKLATQHAETAETYRQSIKDRDRAIATRKEELSQLQQTHAAQTQQVKALNALIRQFEAKVQMSETRTTALVEERNALRSQTKQLIKDAEVRAAAATKELDVLHQQSAKLVKDAEARIDTLAKERDALKQQAADRAKEGEVRAAAAAKELDALHQQSAKLVKDAESRLEALGKERDALRQKLEQLAKDAEARNAAAARELGAVRQEFAQSVKDGEVRARTLAKESEALKSTIAQMDKAARSDGERLRDLTAGLAASRTETAELAAAHEAFRTAAHARETSQASASAALAARVDALQDALEKAGQALQSRDAELRDAREKSSVLAADLNGTIEALRSGAAGAAAELEWLRREHADAVADLETAGRDSGSMSGLEAELHRQAETARHQAEQVDLFRTRSEQLEKSLAAASERTRTLETSLDETRKALAALRSDNSGGTPPGGAGSISHGAANGNGGQPTLAARHAPPQDSLSRAPASNGAMPSLTRNAQLIRDGLFDEAYYRDQLAKNNLGQVSDPAIHYLMDGARAALNPHPDFDTAWYLSNNADVAAAGVNPLVHYLTEGRMEGRAASPTMDINSSTYNARRLYAFPPAAKLAATGDAYFSQKAQRAGKPKVAVYSAITGNYEHLLFHEHLMATADYHLFTDGPLTPRYAYKTLPVPYFETDPTRVARFVKTHPHLLFRDYEVAIWLDGNVLVRDDISALVEKFLRSDLPIAAVPHPLRTSVYEEAAECMKRNKDKDTDIAAQIERYRAEGFDCDDLIESNFMMFRISHPKLAPVLDAWWAEIDGGSRRDQLSFNRALKKADTSYFPLTRKPSSVRNHAALALFQHGSNKPPAEPQLVSSWPAADARLSYHDVLAERTSRHGDKTVDVVVCVHNALDVVMLCLNSVAESRNAVRHRIVIVDDGSNAETGAWLDSFKASHRNVHLIRHKKAGGYTRAANAGLRAMKADMAILLNSDTIVAGKWIEKMLDVVHANPGVGIVGPLSSAASTQSVPDHKSTATQTAVNDMPPGFSVADMNAWCERNTPANFVPRVPLVHGFCFGVTRETVQKVGYFDEENFPFGYGEENDYCFRAVNAGFSLAIATHTYVYHKKSQSYQDERRTGLMKAGNLKIRELHTTERVLRAVRTMQANPHLERMRKLALELFVKPSGRTATPASEAVGASGNGAA